MDPFVNGDYPKIMKDSVRGLPEFTKEQTKMVKKACDYIGVNYYTARYAKQTCTVDSQQGRIRIEYLEDTGPLNFDLSYILKYSTWYTYIDGIMFYFYWNAADIDGNVIGEQAQGQADIYVHPPGLMKLLLYIKQKYNDPELYVTENGEFSWLIS